MVSGVTAAGAAPRLPWCLRRVCVARMSRGTDIQGTYNNRHPTDMKSFATERLESFINIIRHI